MKAYQHLAWTAAAVCALASTPAAASQLFEGSLSGAQENPAVITPATGFGSILLSDDMNSITVNLSWTGLTAPAVAAHVHCCVPTGMNGPVAIGFMPDSLTTGSLSSVFDLTSMSIYNPAFLSANGGTAASARTAFITGLTSGLAYLNIHTSNNPGGEIRAQVSAAVPEPATWAMMLLGFGVVGGAVRYRRRSIGVAFS